MKECAVWKESLILNVQRGKYMRIKKFIIGMVSTNCYVVHNEVTKECFVVDPAAESEELIHYIKKEGLQVKAVLLTHGHFDHIMGIDALLREFAVPVYAGEAEAGVLADAGSNLSLAYGMEYTFSDAEYLQDNAVLEIAGYQIQMLSTPGHTAGGCCYYIASEGVVFSGDTLFCGSIGRTDFPTGSMSQLVSSVKEKLLVLPGDTMVYPGHMEETTIAFEKENNPFLV